MASPGWLLNSAIVEIRNRGFRSFLQQKVPNVQFEFNQGKSLMKTKSTLLTRCNLHTVLFKTPHQYNQNWPYMSTNRIIWLTIERKKRQENFNYLRKLESYRRKRYVIQHTFNRWIIISKLESKDQCLKWENLTGWV